MSQINTYLSREDYERLLKICEVERCSSYTLAKIAILDKIYSYTLTEKGYSFKEKGGGMPEEAEQTSKIGTIKPPKITPDEMARGIAKGARQYL